MPIEQAFGARHAARNSIAPGSPAAPGSLLRPAHFSTAQLPPRQQLAAWREECSTVIDLSAPAGGRNDYVAQYTSWKLGPFLLSHAVAPAASYRRTRTHIRRDSIDHWAISVARAGTHGVRTDAAGGEALPGLPYIFSLDQAFDGERGDIDWLCLFVARDTFPEFGQVIDAARHAPLASSMGRLLAGYIEMLPRHLTAMTEAELPQIVEATRGMITACVAPSQAARLLPQAQVEQVRLARIKLVIRQHLRSPMLGPARLCKLAGVSRSQLYRLFEPFGGVARFIQSERLRQAHRALSDPGDTRDIFCIAEDLGLYDASTFSRVFRREFGCSPSDLRMAARSGRAAAPIARVAAPGRIGFTDLLRRL